MENRPKRDEERKCDKVEGDIKSWLEQKQRERKEKEKKRLRKKSQKNDHLFFSIHDIKSS